MSVKDAVLNSQTCSGMHLDFFFLLLALLATIIATTSSYTDGKLTKSAGDQI